MIVPEARLLWAAACLLLPLSLVPALLPAVLPAAGSAAALAALIAAVDALLGSRRVRGVEVDFPDQVRLARGRQGEILFAVRQAQGRPLALRLGLSLPPGIVSPLPELALLLPPHSRGLPVRWPLTAARRGRFELPACHLRVVSPLGFWGKQIVLPAAVRLSVYPDLLTERRTLAPLLLGRGDPGLRSRRRVGQGREFEKVRDYLPGDSLGDIHWKATARRGRPVTKEYRIERTQEVYVLIDASRLSGRSLPGGTGEAVLERCLTATLALTLAAQRQGDLVGLLTFDAQVRGFLRAKGGRGHFGAVREALHDLQPRPVNPDFRELATFVSLRLRRRALLLVLTSLDDPALADDFVQSLEAVARRHLVVVAMPRPAAAHPLFAGPEVPTVEDLYGRLAGHLIWQRLEALELELKRRGIGFSLIDDGRLGAELIARYLEVKGRQIL